ncbi:heavy-metal-associated domain-containing protein [Methyloceanibacter sp.]|uniref:heavy-metal-associated domain-containing protein n=1 Tax=Methyloceanibacter sp. TaxID=1965321 RepID=UPI002C4A88C5|nr:heavy-metal-associated domain-containing protein [Methyloceanibacter sp.]HML92964.1 heavy-metal-associated domain-containing protein [Methyloceanibacter sp.]
MKTTTFKVEGMRCDGCADTIKALVEKQQGVRMATVSLEAGEARVLHDPAMIGEDDIASLIERPGYRVTGRR